MLKLRLKRYGKKREPSYRIVVVESRSRRQGRPLQELGFYNPRTKETRLDTKDLLKWLRNGAQPTETLSALLRKAGIYDMLKAGVGLDGGEVAVVRVAAIEPPVEEVAEVASANSEGEGAVDSVTDAATESPDQPLEDRAVEGSTEQVETVTEEPVATTVPEDSPEAVTEEPVATTVPEDSPEAATAEPASETEKTE